LLWPEWRQTVDKLSLYEDTQASLIQWWRITKTYSKLGMIPSGHTTFP